MKSLLLLCGLAVALSPAMGRADESKPLEARAFKPQNVTAKQLSLWLDPINNGGGLDCYVGELAPPVLPEGARGVFYEAKSQNLLIVGTPSGIEKTFELIKILDVRQRQVEIEAHWVRVSISQSSAFGIDFGTTPAAQDIQIGFVRGNFAATLRALQTKERTEVLSAPRVTGFNNLKAKIDFSTPGSAVRNGPAFALTPTINADETVTVMVEPLAREKGLNTVFNVRDGDTIAIGGWPVPAFLPEDKKKVTLLFITPRIVRRVGE